jgi:hypothetical protein
MSLIGATGGLIGAAGVAAAAGGSDPEFGALSTIYESGSTGVTSGQVTLGNVAVGDLVLAFVQRSRVANISTVTCGSQALGQLKSNVVTGGDEYGFQVWGAIATADGAGSSVTITASFGIDSNAWLSMSAARWSNVASATPLASSCNTTGCSALASSSTNRLAQSITTTERALIIAAGTDYDDVRTHTAASGWTKRADGSGTPVTSIQFIHDRVSDAGTYGGATAFSTTSAADQYLSVLLAFEIAS